MLTTEQEILKWTPALRTINRDLWCNSIEVVERNLFLDCLTLDFKDLLESHRIDFTSVGLWSDANIYSNGQMVENDSIIYVSVADNNDKFLSNSDYWQRADFFDEEIYNNLWRIGMAKWICMSIYSETLAYTTYQSGGKGLIKHFEDSGQRTVDVKEFYTYKRQVEGDIKMAHRVMMNFINTYKVELGYETDECESDACRDSDSDRIAW
jgi:hypothetical protein